MNPIIDIFNKIIREKSFFWQKIVTSVILNILVTADTPFSHVFYLFLHYPQKNAIWLALAFYSE